MVDGIVDRVGDGTGEVLGHRDRHGQVTVGELLDLIEQAHDRLLIALILLGGFLQLTMGCPHHHQADQDDRGQRQQPQNIPAHSIEGTPGCQVLEAVGKVRGFVEQCLREAENVPGRFANAEQLGRGFEDFID
ncbi:hypothetical protein D3C78_977240 [compost metagenome]